MSAKWNLFDDTPRPNGRVFRETKSEMPAIRKASAHLFRDSNWQTNCFSKSTPLPPPRSARARYVIAWCRTSWCRTVWCWTSCRASSVAGRGVATLAGLKLRVHQEPVATQFTTAR
jgi:hypothetical protein